MSSRSIHHRNGTTKGSNVQTVSHVVISFRFQHFTCHVYGDRWLSLCNVIVTAINRYGRKTHCTRPAEAWRPSLERTLLWVSEIGLRPKWIWQGSKGQGCEMNGTEEVERFITRGVWFWGLYKKMRDWESFSNKKPLFLQEPLGKNASLAAVSMGRSSSTRLEWFVYIWEQVDCVSVTAVICKHEYQMLRDVLKTQKLQLLN